MIKNIYIISIFALTLSNCSSNNNETPTQVDSENIGSLEYIDEFIIPVQDIEGAEIGGFGRDRHSDADGTLGILGALATLFRQSATESIE